MDNDNSINNINDRIYNTIDNDNINIDDEDVVIMPKNTNNKLLMN